MSNRGGRQQKYSAELENKILQKWDAGDHNTRSIARALQKEGFTTSRGGVQGVVSKHDRHLLYSPKSVELVQSLLTTQMPHKEIAYVMGKAPATISGIAAMLNRNADVLEPMRDMVKVVVGERVAISRLWKPGRYMVVGDFHIKFHSMEALQQALAVKGDFDGCIIAGDFLDEFWISFFRKDTMVTYADELKVANAILELLVKRFGRVLIIHGNHEDRRYKQLLEASKPFLDRAGSDAAAQDLFKVVERIRNWYYNKLPNVTVHPGWFVDVCNGKIIISHPDRFMAVPGNAAKAVVEHMYNYRKVYKLQDFDTLMMGHPHRLDGPKHRIGMTTWEMPAMCPTMPYQTSPKASNSGVIDTGYSVIATRSDGSLIFNESRSYLVDGNR